MIEFRKAQHITKARQLAKQFGVRRAAGYLRNRGWSIESALFILLGK